MCGGVCRWCRSFCGDALVLCVAQQPAGRDRAAQEAPGLICLQKQADRGSRRTRSLHQTGGTDAGRASAEENLLSCYLLSQVLSLANNQLSTLPASFSNLTQLKKLNLSHNLIVHVPGCVYNMKALVGSSAASAQPVQTSAASSLGVPAPGL